MIRSQMPEARSKINQFDLEIDLNYPISIQILDLFRSQNGNSRLAKITKTRILAVRDFCQRYYDPEIGRFTTLDSWTNLPDDERLLSYEKFLTWDNYELKYEPEKSKGMSAYRLKYKNLNLDYDTLSSALVSFQSRPSLSFDAALIKVYPTNLMILGVRTPHYFVYNHQLNGYLYCMNNPLRYIDPTGNIPFGVEIVIVAGVTYIITDMANEFRNTQMVVEFWRENFPKLGNELWDHLEYMYGVDPGPN